MRKIWILAIAAALLISACRIETNVLISINADRTGSFGFEFGMDDEFRQLLASQGDGVEITDMFGDLGSEMPGAVVSERTEGDMTFTVVSIPFEDEAQFRQLLAAGGGDGGNIDVTWGEDSVTINALLEGSGEDGGLGPLGGLGDLGDAAGDLGGDFDLSGLGGFADSFFSGSVIVSMPGEVGANNADRVLPDGRLQWDLKLDGSDVDIQAVSDLGGGSGFPAWAIVLLILVAVAVLLWLYSAQRKRRMVAAIEAAGLAAAAAGETAQPGDWSTPPPAPPMDEAPADEAPGDEAPGGDEA